MLLFASFLALTLATTNVFLDELEIPDGFRISLFANNLPNVRSLVLDPNSNGTVIYAGSWGGCGDSFPLTPVYALIDHNLDGVADQVFNLTQPLLCPNGVAVLDNSLYVALQDTILRYDIDLKTLSQAAPLNPSAEILLTPSLPNISWHGWRYLVASQGSLYISVGSPCNVPGDQDPNCIDTYNPWYGTISKLNFTSPTTAEPIVIARGIRNSVGMTFPPGDQSTMYWTDNGRDNMAPDHQNLPADELNRLSIYDSPPKHYGFPYCYGANTNDPAFYNGSCTPTYIGSYIEFTAHVAPLGLRFYPANQSFPSTYWGSIIVAQHGSWNSEPPRGYRVQHLDFYNGGYLSGDNLIIGWLWSKEKNCVTDDDCPGTAVCQNDNTSYVEPYYCGGWGRPVDVENLLDGSILISDDQNGVIYRLSYGDSSSSDDDWWNQPGGYVVFGVVALVAIVAGLLGFAAYRTANGPSFPIGAVAPAGGVFGGRPSSIGGASNEPLAARAGGYTLVT